ncbi:MAG: sigma-70 family RNA polymerase sigma factor [Myxococcales bacterium]|nr:sigma-70 family RNA polymerase sigma factor [Myxococcales bacterium]MCB9756686.1 sigma-70 family RNA polymerase sigma factor [Myxococcales bacterium]
MRSDVELLDAWRQGDRKAGDEFVLRYFDAISRFFRNKVCSDEDATDLVTQTFLACTSAKQRFRGESNARRFLYAIAHKVLLRYIEKRYKRKREVEDFASVCVQQLAPASMSSIVMHKREAQALVQALREIPVTDQIVLELMYFDGLSGREISERLNLSEGTVRGRISRGKDRLQRRVAELLGGSIAAGSVEAVSADELATWARDVREHEGWPT